MVFAFKLSLALHYPSLILMLLEKLFEHLARCGYLCVVCIVNCNMLNKKTIDSYYSEKKLQTRRATQHVSEL